VQQFMDIMAVDKKSVRRQACLILLKGPLGLMWLSLATSIPVKLQETLHAFCPEVFLRFRCPHSF
jgi:hypothetical protein